MVKTRIYIPPLLRSAGMINPGNDLGVAYALKKTSVLPEMSHGPCREICKSGRKGRGKEKNAKNRMIKKKVEEHRFC